jgi:P2 family phage major capsid protein
MWSKFDNFQARIRDAIIERQALDRIMIGFNGTSRAATSNKVANPLLQDVNIGWLEKCRLNAAARVMDEGATPGEIRIGAAAGRDYFNLDALVMDMVASLIEPWHRKDPNMVCIVGNDLMHDKYFPLVNKDNPNTEALAADLIISQKRIGGLQGVTAPFVPDGTVIVTSLDNLSIYWQEGSRRRTFRDNPEKDQYENFESSNEAYVVEDHGRMAVAENLTLEWA